MSAALSNPRAHSVFHACVASSGSGISEGLLSRSKRGGAEVRATADVQVVRTSAKATAAGFAEDASKALIELQAKYLDVDSADTNRTSYFVKRGDAFAGVYVGGSLVKQTVAATLLQKLNDYIFSSADLPQTVLSQLCGEGRNADSVAGAVVDGRGGVEAAFAVQAFARTWAESNCVNGLDGSARTETLDIAYIPTRTDSFGHVANVSDSVTAAIHLTNDGSLERRADCRVVQVVSGDSCGLLADRCGLSPPDFTKLHPETGFCSTLKPGQWVCCSPGTLPDMRSKPNGDGSCFSYTVWTGDWCSTIEAAHGLATGDIEKMNQKTWGFAGCDSLWPNMHICLSRGDPPMPAEIPNAVCGPQKPGTQRPTNNTSLASLNPCPLKACCNAWGQCGTTEEFCTESSLGPPGTAEIGKAGCISNCGMDIVNNNVAPAKQMTVGYFEAWNYERGCLHMDVTQMSKSITHIHFAFVDVTETFSVSTAKVQHQWNLFKGMAGHHKVAAFGGWAASTEPMSYWIFREGVKAENRVQLATNLAKFILENNMDGIDLDWEYPGAKDLPGIPSADPFDGDGYLELLKMLRRRLGTSKTISIAAPASYWYLQGFPIAEMAKVVDYIIYMTYDLHGQWDFENKYSMPGCPERESCLRSHINMTETINALSMITKAGVPANKIVIGVSSYGRSFEMKKPGCFGPQCSFTGPESTAKKGRCTDTNGYISNAEIDEILKASSIGGKRAGTVQHFTDDTESQIMIYDETHWVAYMDDENKARRKEKWASLNFAGTTDWAVDLASFTPGDDNKWCYRTKNYSAWEAGVEYYRKTGKYNRVPENHFVRAISNFYHGEPNMDCGILATQNGWAHLVLNSLVSLNNFFINSYEGIVETQGDMDTTGNMDKFVSTFAPEAKEPLAIKIILDIVSFALMAATGPYFNNFLRNTKWGKENKDASDNYKDTSRAVITFSFTAGKDSMAEKESAVTGADIATQLTKTVRFFKEVFTDLSAEVFSGSDKSIEVLWAAIKEGKLLDSLPISRMDMVAKLSKLFYAMMIPHVWRKKGWRPVLIDGGPGCDGKVGDIDQASKVCFEGRKYFFARPDGGAMKCPPERSVSLGMSCTTKSLKALDGIDKLKLGSWGDLEKEDLVASIVARAKTG
ncbi:hypothetical protein OQA88_5064 [Cercophora sp. LCS_1]